MSKRTQRLILALLASLAVSAALASGYRSPAHSQLCYSFTCPAGGSGHLSYQRSGPPTVGGALTFWVNGIDLHEHARLRALRDTHNLEQVAAACNEQNVMVWLTWWHVAKARKRSQAIQISATGEVSISDDAATSPSEN